MLDVLNRERPITRTYPDGSFDCPFCAAAVITPNPRCENPWCPASAAAMANPASAPAFQAKLDQEETRQRESSERQRNHTLAMERIVEDHRRHEVWRQEQIAEATKRGACLRCLFAPGYQRVKLVRHRGACPRQRIAA